MMKKLADRMERAVGQTSCSPTVFLLVLLLAVVALGYHYIDLVVRAAMLTAGTAGMLFLLIGMALIARTLVRAKRGVKATPKLPATVATTPQDAIAIEADLLADDKVQLAVGQDGKILQQTSARE